MGQFIGIWGFLCHTKGAELARDCTDVCRVYMAVHDKVNPVPLPFPFNVIGNHTDCVKVRALKNRKSIFKTEPFPILDLLKYGQKGFIPTEPFYPFQYSCHLSLTLFFISSDISITSGYHSLNVASIPILPL